MAFVFKYLLYIMYFIALEREAHAIKINKAEGRHYENLNIWQQSCPVHEGKQHFSQTTF